MGGANGRERWGEECGAGRVRVVGVRGGEATSGWAKPRVWGRGPGLVDLVRLCLFMCCCRCSCIQAGVAAFLVAGALLIKCRVYTGILVAGASITAFGGNLFSFVFSHTSLLFSMHQPA